jgi:hypothetical protein
MAYQGIGTGTTPNDGTGDSLLSGAVKINSNFQEIYNALGDGSNLAINTDGTSTFNQLNVNSIELSGISTSNQTVFKSVTEEFSIASAGNSVANISFSGGDGNIVYFSNPSGNITLNINDIPTTNFDNKVLTFTVVVNQSATAYICNDLKLNGASKTINWQFGEVPSGNPNSIDFINFIGINTVGSGSTTNNYLIVGNVNGDYK